MNWDRSLDDSLPEDKPRKFRSISKTGSNFGNPPDSLLSKAGLRSLISKRRTNLNFSQSRIDDEREYSSNKRKILENKEQNLWKDPNKTCDLLFMPYPVDKQVLRRKFVC